MKKLMYAFLMPICFLVACEGLNPITPQNPTSEAKKFTYNNQEIDVTYIATITTDISDKELINLAGLEQNVSTSNINRYVEAEIELKNNQNYDFTATYTFTLNEASYIRSLYLRSGEFVKIKPYFFTVSQDGREIIGTITNPIGGAFATNLPNNAIDKEQGNVSKPCGIVIYGNKVAVSQVPFSGYNNSVVKIWNSVTDFQNNAVPARTLVADEPEAMAASPLNGHLAVCENWQKKIVIYDANWQNVIATLGVNDNLNYPRGITFNANGDLYVCDDFNHRILKYTYSAGSYQTQGQVILNLAANSAPKDIAIDNQGSLFIADYNYGILKFDKKAGNVYTIPADKTTGWIGNAVNLELKSNLLYVSYHGSNPNKIAVFNPFTLQSPSNTNPSNPEYTGFANEQQDVAVDDNGNVYVADYNANKIAIYKK